MRVRLIHWKAAEAQAIIALLQQAGHTVDYEEKVDYRLAGQLRAHPPAVIAIHLGRLPSHGRAIGASLATQKGTREIPVLFFDGDPAKVPGAQHCQADELLQHLSRARPGVAPEPAAPKPERTVAMKLGITEGLRIQVIDAPAAFPRLLGPLPPAVDFTEEPAAFTIAFAHDPGEFQAALPSLRRAAQRGKLWIAWRKQSARNRGNGLNAPAIREFAARLGLVDWKVCSLDADWSAIAFAIKK